MSMSVYFQMVVPAIPLAGALSDILERWEKVGYISYEAVREYGSGGKEVDFTGEWEDRVNALQGVVFSAHRVGPPIDASLRKLNRATLSAGFSMQDGGFNKIVASKTLPENYYAPILQAALALGARYGVGGLEMEFFPTSEEEIAARMWDEGTLGFVRCDVANPKDLRAKTRFTMTERPEGYWWLENPDFLTSI